MVRLGSSGLLANQMMLTVIVVFRAWFPAADFKFRALGNKSRSFCEAVNCERSEQEGKFLFATLWFQCLVSSPGSIRALGNKSGSFCEAVNCERSEQEGRFLFAI